MKKLFTAIFVLAAYMVAFAQEDIAVLRENARKSMMSGDMGSAITILNKAYQIDKTNPEVQKDLAQAYYYNKDYSKALNIIKPLTESPDADVISYQIAGNIYKAQGNPKEAEKLYKNGIKDFPKSGSLYNEYGQLLEVLKNPKGALEMWEKGIEVAPSYGPNYYNAAIHYYKEPKDKIFAIIYGEIYANMESMNPKSLTIKKMVLDTYKDIFTSNNLATYISTTKNEFAKAVLETYAKQAGITGQGINPETLAMARTRFVLDWNAAYAKKFPFKLFEYHTQLMKDGLFDSYNQWMFGPAANQPAFENWAAMHKEEYEKFTQFHTTRIFKMPAGQAYSTK